MKAVTKYKNEITGAEFNDKEKCRKSEAESLSIKKIFSFWKENKNPKDSCEFSNGGWCFQRSSADLDALTHAIIKAVALHEPSIAEDYQKKDGGIKPVHVNAQFWLGRILSESNSEIYHFLCIHGSICSRCYREYGQQYYAINCKCDGKIETRKMS